MSGTPLTDAINALTTYSNTVTGASDTTLSEAVATLAAGYGGGGSGWTTEGIALHTEPTGAIVLSDITIVNNAFQRNTNITSVDLTDCVVSSYAFSYCSGITSLTVNEYGDLTGQNAFEYCTGLTDVNLTAKGKYFGSNQFQYCTNMTSWKAPYHGLSSSGTEMNNVQMGNGMFRGCTALTVVDYGHPNGMFANTFNGCTALRTLVIRRSTVCTAQAWNANNFGGIYNNPTASTIYVPQDLISSYQTASNWSSAYSAGVTFAKIEGSIYEL